jgi:hypothetical protein
MRKRKCKKGGIGSRDVLITCVVIGFDLVWSKSHQKMTYEYMFGLVQGLTFN